MTQGIVSGAQDVQIQPGVKRQFLCDFLLFNKFHLCLGEWLTTEMIVFVLCMQEPYHSTGVGSTSHSQQWGTSLLQQTAPSIPHLVATASACQKQLQNVLSQT